MAQILVEEALSLVRDHLRALGIQPLEERKPPASQVELSAAETAIRAELPDEMRQLYLAYANGLSFRWASAEDFDDADAFGAFELPDLPSLVRGCKTHRDFWTAAPLDLSKYRNPETTRNTMADMQYWLPFWEEGNGDEFCMDLRDGRIVFNEHDWFDGGDGTNGHLLASNFRELITNWSRVCFAAPMSLYWPDAFSADGIDWSSKHFHEDYIIR